MKNYTIFKIKELNKKEKFLLDYRIINGRLFYKYANNQQREMTATSDNLQYFDYMYLNQLEKIYQLRDIIFNKIKEKKFKCMIISGVILSIILSFFIMMLSFSNLLPIFVIKLFSLFALLLGGITLGNIIKYQSFKKDLEKCIEDYNQNTAKILELKKKSIFNNNMLPRLYNYKLKKRILIYEDNNVLHCEDVFKEKIKEGLTKVKR